MDGSSSSAHDTGGSRSVAVFARWPVPGNVKPRLSPALPPVEACRLYEAMLADAADAACECHAGRALVYWEDPPENERDWLRLAPVLEPRRQYGANPAARLRDAFVALLEKPGDRAVVVGAGCPLLDGGVIDRAFAALDSADAVIAPTRDGGHGLVGLARPAPALFEGIDWGAGRMLEPALERARAARLRVTTLDPLEIIETPEDLLRLLVRALSPPPSPARRTLDALRGMGLLPPGTTGG